jgi:hypothetical protein
MEWAPIVALLSFVAGMGFIAWKASKSAKDFKRK